MNKKKILIKTPLMEVYLRNERNEKVSYIDLPVDSSQYSLEEDIKKGGIQFAELLELTRKKKLARVISMSADSLEMGLMAVSYLAMHLIKNRKEEEEGMYFDCGVPEQQWVETYRKIPVIYMEEILSYMRNRDFPYERHGVLMAQAQTRNTYQPYWKNCRNEAVCIVVRRTEIDSDSLQYMNLFSQNRNVFVLFLEGSSFEGDIMEELPFGSMDVKHFQALRNNYILSNAADAINVSMGSNDGQLYYRNILKQNFIRRDIKVGKGFSYARVVNLAIFTNKEKVCEMIDKIVDIKSIYGERKWLLSDIEQLL